MDSRFMAPPSPLLDAALAVLADGKPRTADHILAEGLRRGLFDASQTRKHIYTALSQYVQRTLGRGRKPLIVEEADRRFRLNRPIDDWPDLDTTGLPPLVIPTAPPPTATATLTALQNAVAGTDSRAFERAVCATFELFGFAVTHVGGNDAPDGYADALLGPLAYRTMLECKLARDDTVSQSDAVAEAAKYRDAYHADYCALVAPSFDAEVTFVSELRTHNVAAWSVADLVRAVTLRLDAVQLRALFASGYAADPLDDLAWDLIHGPAKRLRVIGSLLVEIGLTQQKMSHDLSNHHVILSVASDSERSRKAELVEGLSVASAHHVILSEASRSDAESKDEGLSDTPLLTRDVALALIDDRIAAAGSTRGVTRDEIDAAFTWLTSPYVNRAVWSDAGENALVIL